MTSRDIVEACRREGRHRIDSPPLSAAPKRTGSYPFHSGTGPETKLSGRGERPSAPFRKLRVATTFSKPAVMLKPLRDTLTIAAFPILADPVDVKKSDQLCETVSQPSIRPDKVDPPMGS